MELTRDISTNPPGVFKVFNIGLAASSYFGLVMSGDIKLSKHNLAYMCFKYGTDMSKWPKRCFTDYDNAYNDFVKVLSPTWESKAVRSSYVPRDPEGITYILDKINPQVGRHETLGIRGTFDTRSGHLIYVNNKQMHFEVYEVPKTIKKGK